jgi:phosphatidylglycerophosphatase A
MWRFLITGFYTGYLKPAPGTWGSAGAVGAFALAHWLSGGNPAVMIPVLAVIAVLASVGCIAFGQKAERHFGEKDPGQVNLDEWAGQAVALIALPPPPEMVHPWLGWPSVAWTMIFAFLAFRVFDILKPFPAGRSQKLPAGWGIVIDDLIAGVYANILCQILLRVVL